MTAIELQTGPCLSIYPDDPDDRHVYHFYPLNVDTLYMRNNSLKKKYQDSRSFFLSHNCKINKGSEFLFQKCNKYILKDIRNAPLAEMLIYCQKLYFNYMKNKIDRFAILLAINKKIETLWFMVALTSR